MHDRLASFDGGSALRDLRQLCDPAMAGRLAGTEGEHRAADYLEAELRAMGLGVRRDPFEVLVPELTEEPSVSIAGRPLVHLEQFCVNVQGAAASGRVAAEAVWLDGAET